MSNDIVFLPVQLDAFVLNRSVCGTGEEDDHGSRIVPITQPNYTFLRLDNFVLQSDVQIHADVHDTSPAILNPRLTDLGSQPSPAPRRSREGVYLHWVLPRAYRATIEVEGSDTPGSIPPPTRWLVVRKLDLESVKPATAKSSFKDKEYQAWVVESDRLWMLDEIPLDVDLEVDVSPFVLGATGDDVDIGQQAEVFIGKKTPLENWKDWTTLKPHITPPDISLLRSSNQLFADFQLHNSNVFSMVDNFQYGKSDEPQYLEAARASYYVMGWHWKPDHDPLSTLNLEEPRSARLAKLFMSLQNEGNFEDWLGSEDPAQLICHGAMYDVNWDRDKKPDNVPADEFARRLQDPEIPAISIGTTPIDSLITYCSARKGLHTESSVVSKLEEDILAIDSLLHARDDGVEGQREAKETIYNWNFSRTRGGTRYFLGEDEANSKPTEVDPKLQQLLVTLNRYQLLLDSCNRACDEFRWDMFSRWWKYVSDVTNKAESRPIEDAAFLQETNRLGKQIKALETHMSLIQTAIDDIKGTDGGSFEQNTKSGTLPFFYGARDPTVLVGGIDSGWASDHLDNVAVRLPSQAVPSPSALPTNLVNLVNIVRGKSDILPAIQSGIAVLLAEFYALRPENTQPTQGTKPQFHDQKTADQRWRDRWGNRQPWFPLFVEWEAEYVHIPIEYWRLDAQAARLSDNKLVRYGIKVPDDVPLYDELVKDPNKPLDVRIASGRVLILPQPSFSLMAKVSQLFSDTPPKILDEYLDEDRRKELLQGINQLSYLSCSLTGLTENLVTLSPGSHIKPENKTVDENGERITAIKSALFEKVGLTNKHIELIQGNSAFTPFASMKRFANTPYCPFKPATHGQLRFRKFNIIDKFGQALVGIDQNPREKGPPPLYPCISDWFEPQMVDEQTANTATRDENGQCEYIQIPPQINQNSRLNASFLISTTKDKPLNPVIKDAASWRPATEWENPVWGWIVTNYADYGIQFFLPNGTFYREVRIGGPNGALTSPKWMPFKPEDSDHTVDTEQLDALISRVSEAGYLKGFWSMITTALGALPPAPSTYAQFLNSIVGKPLALVNMGWSLELDKQALQNQSTNSALKYPNPPLLPLPTGQSQNEPYWFQVKLGDKEREYDGLVGYFDVKDKIKNPKELNLDTINTYFMEGDIEPLKRITSDSYPKFRAFWVSPFPEDGLDEEHHPPLNEFADNYINSRNRAMERFGGVYGAIIDPFTAVHAYSSILPARELQLPSWTWQEAMNTMTAFFHAGPMNITEDVKPYEQSRRLTTKNMKDLPPNNVAFPALASGDWNWLQPYVDPDPEAIRDLDAPPAFNSYGIDPKGNLTQPGFQEGPYTAIEGYLQLRHPIMVNKKDK